MKRAWKVWLPALCAGTALMASGCATGFVESAPKDVTATSATLTGSVGSDRSEQGVYWFEYGTTANYGRSTPQQAVAFKSNSKIPVSQAISGLTGNTEYHYKLCAKDNDPNTGAHCSGDASFETGGIRPDRPRYRLHIDANDGTTSDPQSGVTGVSISVDGQEVDGSQPGCASENCSIAEDWALENNDYAPGTHRVTVRVTDGVGRTTTRNMDVEIQRDTTGPKLVASGPLRTAPKGWVGQGRYDVTANASDGGYGVTNLKLLVDGRQVGQAATQSCADGGCPLGRTFTVDTSGYGGGAHTAKLIATDGAGNTSDVTWTVNVNPDGNVSAAEATATLQAADATSAQPVVAPNSVVIDPDELSAGVDPHLQQSGTTLSSTGTAADSTMTVNPTDGFTIKTPDDPIKVTPLQVDGTATTAGVANSVAAVSGNTASGVDSVVRPIFDGLMTFQSIRDDASPQDFSWRVALDTGQTMKSIDSQNAQIYYADGTPALLISVQVAHDAAGATVPTTLAVRGDVITLTVAHQGKGFVYPIAAGSGWQAPYILSTEDQASGETDYTVIGAPVLRTDEVDVLERQRTVHERPFYHKFCSQDLPLPDCKGAYLFHSLKGSYFYSGKYGTDGGHAWWNKSKGSYVSCADHGAGLGVAGISYSWTKINCLGFVGPNFQPYGHGKHITACSLDYWEGKEAGAVVVKSGYKPISAYLYGSGNITWHRSDEGCFG